METEAEICKNHLRTVIFVPEDGETCLSSVKLPTSRGTCYHLPQNSLATVWHHTLWFCLQRPPRWASEPNREQAHSTDASPTLTLLHSVTLGKDLNLSSVAGLLQKNVTAPSGKAAETKWLHSSYKCQCCWGAFWLPDKGQVVELFLWREMAAANSKEQLS